MNKKQHTSRYIYQKNKKASVPKWVILSRDVYIPRWVILSRDVYIPTKNNPLGDGYIPTKNNPFWDDCWFDMFFAKNQETYAP